MFPEQGCVDAMTKRSRWKRTGDLTSKKIGGLVRDAIKSSLWLWVGAWKIGA